MGVVYEAYDQERGELVALKTMRRVDPTRPGAVQAGISLLSDITHPNLVNLYELFAVEDRWFFTMELVEGGDFVSYVKSRPEPVSFRVALADAADDTSRRSRERGRRKRANRGRHGSSTRRACATRCGSSPRESMRCTSRASCTETSSRPTCLVTAEGRVVLLDFGLTADLESLARQQAVDRQIVGTVGHMSPEQSAGRSITAASDWYSVGVMLLRGDDGPVAVYRLAGRGLASPSRRSRPHRPIRSSWGCRKIWCASASRSSTETRPRDQRAVM